VTRKDGLSSAVLGGEFAGSRGKGEALVGFSFQLRGATAESYEGTYRALFIDGSTVGPTPLGELCFSANQAPLQAFQIALSRKK
jgi:hypothetical protein